MKVRIREGNDFDVVWAITRAGQPEDLSTATNMKLTLVVYGAAIEHNLFTVTDNVLSINIPKEVATIKGDYRLVFEYTLPDAGQPDGDLKCKTDVVPFRIVPFTADADDVYTVNTSSDVLLGFKGDKGGDGDDAYQIWLDLGNVGTYEDFIAYLRQPAVDAGASISELEGEIQASEGLRVQAETARANAEGDATKGRVKAENERVQAEIERAQAETARANAEGDATKGRVKAENDRVTAEGERAQAETARANAEGDATKGRVKAENERVQAEIERAQAETARVNAEGDATKGRVKAENERVAAEGERAAAETARANAEGDATKGRVKAENDRVTAEGERAQAFAQMMGEADDKIEEMNTTLSTYDGRVTQVESDIDQLAGEVSLLDAVHSDKIKDIENVISTMNPSQSAQLSVSGRKIVSLPKNASNGGMQVKLEGLTAENLVVNGDFRSGTTGWGRASGTLSAANNELTYTVDALSGSARAEQTIDIAIPEHKYYARGYINPKYTNTVSLSMGGTMAPVAVNMANAWNRVSAIMTATHNARFRVYLNTISPYVVGDTIKLKDIMTIDLTATFGAGNEPDLATCDAMFSDYFDGVKSFVPTGRVRSVGKNLFDESIDITKLPIRLINNTLQLDVWLKPNTQYTLSSNIAYTPIANIYFNGGDSINNGVYIGKNQTKTSDSNGYLFIIFRYGGYAIGSQTIEQLNLAIKTGDNFIQLEQGASATPYEPYRDTSLYLTAPELRSNGTVKDEIRKGANGYELVKRVGVGTLGNNAIDGGDFEGGLIGDILNNVAANVVSFGTWSENTALPISGTKDGRLVVNQAGTSNIRPALTFTNQRVNGEWRLLSFNYKVNSGTCILRSINIGSTTPPIVNVTLSGTGKYSLWFKADGSGGLVLYFDGRNLFDLQIDALSEQKLNIPDGEPLSTSLFSTIGSNTHYTLATQQIIPISYGGILNSAENGTVYHEPVIADAGVYGTNMPILLTDYPIASIEEIIKHEGGVDTYLNASTAVIAPDGLSFTHPDLASGDLVLFTYSFAKESTNGNITATFYDSNVVKIDTVTGKAYKITEVVTNGVLTRTLTEV